MRLVGTATMAASTLPDDFAIIGERLWLRDGAACSRARATIGIDDEFQFGARGFSDTTRT